MTMAGALVNEPVPLIEELTAKDRCDACGAQAYVKAGKLLFCGHHFTKHEAALMAFGLTVNDQRWRLEAGNTAFKRPDA